MNTDPAPTREMLTARVGSNGIAWLERVALDTLTSRSEVIRVCFAVARRHEAEVIALLRSKK